MIAKNKNNQKNPVGQVTYYSTGLALLHLPFFPCERETEKTFTALHHSDISIAALRRVPGVELYSLCTHGPARDFCWCAPAVASKARSLRREPASSL
jgi:hypothetical protein